VATATLRTWAYRYKSPVDGRMRQVRIGHWPAVGLPAALAAWERLKVARDAGGDPAAEKRAKRHQKAAAASAEAYTVRRACDDWLAQHKRRVLPKTYAEAARLLDRELDAIADRPAASITRGDAFDLIEGKTDAPVVAAALRQALGAVWDRALDAGKLSPDVPNWWRLVLRGKLVSQGKAVKGKKVGPVKRVLSNAEVGELLRWLPNHTRDMEDALTLYLWTCCRGAEIVTMERAEISEEPDGLWWTVPRAKLKMRRNPLTTDLRVPLIGRAEAIVRRRVEASTSSWVFASRGASGHIEQKAIGVAVWTHAPGCESRPEWVRPRCPVDGWAPHDLRRTGRTMLAALGCPAEIAEAILGHQQPGIVATYNRHNYDTQRRQWLTELSRHLEACAQDQGPRR
jgi:integrase